MELNDIVKNTINILMEQAGFKIKKSNYWYKEINGGLLFTHLKKSKFNNKLSDFCWNFYIAVIPEEKVNDTFINILIEDPINSIRTFQLLPYHGYFMEQMGGEFWDFEFKTYHSDTNIEYTYDENNKIVEDIFTNYICPFLNNCNSIEEWNNNKIEIKRKYQEKIDIYNVIRFFSGCLNTGIHESNLKFELQFYKKCKLNRKIIEDNYDFLERLLNKCPVEFKNENENKIKKFIEKVIQKAEEYMFFDNEFCKVYIELDYTYTLNSTDNINMYEVLLNPVDHNECYSCFHINAVFENKTCDFGLIGSKLVSIEADNVILEKDTLIINTSNEIIKIDLYNKEVLNYIKVEDYIYSINKINGNLFIAYAEQSIRMFDYDLNEKWIFMGKDAFISISGKNPFEICEDKIKLYDISDNYYELDFSGKQIN